MYLIFYLFSFTIDDYLSAVVSDENEKRHLFIEDLQKFAVRMSIEEYNHFYENKQPPPKYIFLHTFCRKYGKIYNSILNTYVC